MVTTEIETRDSAMPQLKRGDLPRLIAIIGHTTPLLASLLRDQKRWIFWGGPVARTEDFHLRRARKLVSSIATLGPAFVKLAQVFSARSDLIPEPYLGELAKLTDQVPPVPWLEIEETLRDSWGAEPTAVLDEINPTPIAAGSIGQVHRGRYHGRDVAVKVLRPGVEAVVLRDARLAQSIVAWVYRRWPHHHVQGFAVVLREFDLHIREEMDFEREAAECIRMKTRFREEKRLRIPSVESELTRRHVMVMEYLEGTRIDRLDDAIHAGQVSARQLTETLIEVYARMMLRDGVFHADPHPGNLLVDSEGRLVLLDFGMVINVPVATRKALFETILAAIHRDPEGTANGFRALGMIATDASPTTIRELVASLLDLAYTDMSMSNRAHVLAERVMHELLDWPIVVPGELVYFARTAALIEGVGVRYDSHFNSIKVASPVVLRLRGELLAALMGVEGTPKTIVTWAGSLGAIAGVIAGKASSWLDRLSDDGSVLSDKSHKA